jgi:hypothetical protein
MVGATQGQAPAHVRPRVTADVVLPVPARLAAERLTQAFQAAGHGGPVLMTVGPGHAGRGVGKRVRVSLARADRRGSTEVFELRWEPVGPAASAYPTLDACLGITPVDVMSSLLSIVASYRPPLGILGATIDRAALSRVADATVASVLHRLADAVAHPSRPLVDRSADTRPVVRSVTS